MRKEITVTMEIENDALNENNGTTAKIDVLLVEPGQYPRMVTIDSGLESLQKAVGGDIQAVYWFDDPVALICDEEGKLKGSRPNRALYDEDGYCRREVSDYRFRGRGFHVSPEGYADEVREDVPRPAAVFPNCRTDRCAPDRAGQKTEGKRKTNAGRNDLIQERMEKKEIQ